MDQISSSLMPSINMLNAITERQKVVSNNIANAHTPGYNARQVSFSDLLIGLNNPFETRLSKEMGRSLQQDEAMATNHPVDLQEEMLSQQQNFLYFSMASRRLTTIFTTLRTASQIGR